MDYAVIVFFGEVTMKYVTPCSVVLVYRRFGGMYFPRVYAWFLLLAGCVLGLLFVPEMEVVCYSETAANLYQTARHFIPEDNALW